MKNILDLVAEFQIKAENIHRYEHNPFVKGDSIAEHLSRAGRLLAYITPDLIDEFPDQPSLIGDIFVSLMIHDDDEIIDGFDIPTVIKNHNIKDANEISAFAQAVSSLPDTTQKFLVNKFSSFRNKSTLSAQIAKAIDNITGNQLVIEQRIGLVNPDSARFCIEYAQKVLGISSVIDNLVLAQINQIIEIRNLMHSDESEVKKISEQCSASSISIKQLLDIDVMNHVLDKSKVYAPI